MGQRSQILVQVINNKGISKNTMYHVQWGQGRIMFMQLINLILKAHMGRPDDIFENTTLELNCGAIDITNTLSLNLIQNININSLYEVKKCFDECENEEGGLVIQVIQTKYDSDTRIGFLLRDKKNDSIIPKYVKPNVYIKHHGYDYVGADFKKMFNYFTKSYDIEVMFS